MLFPLASHTPYHCSWRWRSDGGQKLCPPWAAGHAVKELRIFEACITSVVLQLAEALSCLHSTNFSHNDLHEGNVLLSMNVVGGGPNARVGICDWGRATNAAEEKRLTLHGKNTRKYIAPEHIVPVNSSQKGAATACSSDVYSFGYLMKLVLRNRGHLAPKEWLEVAQICQLEDKNKRPPMAVVLSQLKACILK